MFVGCIKLQLQPKQVAAIYSPANDKVKLQLLPCVMLVQMLRLIKISCQLQVLSLSLMMNNYILGCQNLVSVCSYTREEICTYSVKEHLSCYHFNTLLLRTLMSMHFIMSYHPCHYLCIHDVLFHAHKYRIARRSNPTEILRRGGGQSRDTPNRSSQRRGAGH